MRLTTVVQSATAQHGPLPGGFSGMLRALGAAFRRDAYYSDASFRLTRLSRRELADIGVEDSADSFAWRLASDRAQS